MEYLAADIVKYVTDNQDYLREHATVQKEAGIVCNVSEVTYLRQ